MEQKFPLELPRKFLGNTVGGLHSGAGSISPTDFRLPPEGRLLPVGLWCQGTPYSDRFCCAEILAARSLPTKRGSERLDGVDENGRSIRFQMQKIPMDGLLENHLESCGTVGPLDDRRSSTSYLEIRLQCIQQVGGKRSKTRRRDDFIYGFVFI
jgi:hypothetical protein